MNTNQLTSTTQTTTNSNQSLFNATIKGFLIILTITLIISILSACNANTNPEVSAKVTNNIQPTATTQQPNSDQSSSLTETYTITKVIDNQTGNDEYFGQSTTNDTQIYFTSDYVQSIGQLETGDTITAVFETYEDDSLLYVTKNK